MSVVRAWQRSLTAVVPHQANNRLYVPKRRFSGTPLPSLLLEGDSWVNFGSAGTAPSVSLPYNFVRDWPDCAVTNNGASGAFLLGATGTAQQLIDAIGAASPGQYSGIVWNGGVNDMAQNNATLANLQTAFVNGMTAALGHTDNVVWLTTACMQGSPYWLNSVHYPGINTTRADFDAYCIDWIGTNGGKVFYTNAEVCTGLDYVMKPYYWSNPPGQIDPGHPSTQGYNAIARRLYRILTE